MANSVEPQKMHVERKKPTNERDLLNLTGSPLKDSCCFDSINESFSEPIESTKLWTDLEETYHPIKFSQAQYV